MTSLPEAPLLEVRDLAKAFPIRRTALQTLRCAHRRAVHALNGVSLTVRRGETLGIVGESGCGKSTLARCLVRLIEADAGTIQYDGIDVRQLAGLERRAFNRRVQLIFQDPYSSLNPRMTVRQTLAEVLAVHRLRPPRQIPNRIAELLALVYLPRDALERYPHEFSGGQRQRIGIARALAVEPECLIADELVSALDVSVQAQVINLLARAAGSPAPDRPVRRPRSPAGTSHLAPGGGDVSRADRRARPHRPPVPGAAPSLHPGAARRGARARPDPTLADRGGARRAAEPGRDPGGLSVSSTLPACL